MNRHLAELLGRSEEDLLASDAGAIVEPIRDDDDRIEGALAVVREIWGRESVLNDPVDRWCGSVRLRNTRGEPIAHDQCWMARAVREGKPYLGCEILIERADGTRRTVLAHANPLLGESGDIIGAIDVLIDLTERKRDQVSLRESEERFARFMDHLPGMAWIKDLEGRYVFANNAALEAFGCSPEDLYGKLDSEIFPQRVVAQYHDTDGNALAALEGSDAVETLARTGCTIP